MPSMFESLESRTLFASATPTVLPAFVLPTTPLVVNNHSISFNGPYVGTFHSDNGDIPITITATSQNKATVTSTILIKGPHPARTFTASAAAPTDAVILKQKLTNSYTTTIDASGNITIEFKNFVRPAITSSTGATKHEAITRVIGTLHGRLSADNKTFSGTMTLAERSNKNHVRTGRFSATFNASATTT
jgi:hypothetical protein